MLCLVGPLPLGRGRNIMAETSHMTRLNSSASLAHSNFPEREGTDANVCIAVADLGAAYGTAKSGVGICSMGVMHPTLIMKSIIPVVMAGVIGIYGFIIAVVVGTKIKEPIGGGTGSAVVPQYTLFAAFGHLGSGLTGGLSGLAAGMAIGIVGDAGVRATAQQPKLFVGMILILIFAEALGLYGLIVALIMSSAGGGTCPEN